MRPNLSLESITGALAVLGTGVLMAACGGSEAKTPVNSAEVPSATDKAAAGDAHCGANKDHKTGEAQCSAGAKHDDPTTAAKPDTAAAGASAAGAMPTPASTSAAATPASPMPASAGGAAPATTGAGKKAPAAPAAAPKKGGAASCGAGTCGAKK